jgi:hypothetical protein
MAVKSTIQASKTRFNIMKTHYSYALIVYLAFINSLSKVQSEEDVHGLVGNGVLHNRIRWDYEYDIVFFEAIQRSQGDITKLILIDYLGKIFESRINKHGKFYFDYILADIITSSDYEVVVKSRVFNVFQDVSDDLSLLYNYFSDPNNQKDPLFNAYLEFVIKNCYERMGFSFIKEVFKRLDTEQKIKVVNGLADNHSAATEAVLNKIMLLSADNKNILNLVKDKLAEINDKNNALISRLSCVNEEADIEKEVKSKYDFDYSFFGKAIEKSNSIKAKRIMIKYLTGHEYRSKVCIGNILAEVIKGDYSLELKKLAMSKSVFRHNKFYQLNLYKYFSITDIQKLDLYNIFHELVLADSDEEDSFKFIKYSFEKLNTEKQLLASEKMSDEYKKITYDGIKYRVYKTDADKLQLFWENPETNLPFKRFYKIQDYVQVNGQKLVFIMNGGIFDPGCKPTGLHVEKGKEFRPLNFANREGNFWFFDGLCHD